MGLCLLWKPEGQNSQACIGQLKRDLQLPGKGRRGIGHTGTLDPFAEGLLLVGYGEGSKLLHALGGFEKTYIADAVLGISSNTLDSTGQLDFSNLLKANQRISTYSGDFFRSFLESKIGFYEQTPPSFSAKHVNGKRSYEWARLGQEKALTPKSVEIKKARHLDLSPHVDHRWGTYWVWKFEVRVSAGCYIRALARDWGMEISGSEAHLSKLTRTAIGPYKLRSLSDSVQNLSLEDLKEVFDIKVLSLELADDVKHGSQPQGNSAGSRPELWVVEGSSEPIAWREAGQSRVKRVFNSNPLEKFESLKKS